MKAERFDRVEGIQKLHFCSWQRFLRTLFFFIVVAAANGWAQITSVSLDLRNNFSFSQTRQSFDNTSLRTFGQYYVLAVNGFVLDPKLLTLSLQTSLTDFSSTSNSTKASQSLSSRNFGYYNFSLSLLPNNSYPLTIYASRSQINNVNISSTDAPTIPSNTAEASTDIETMGLRWNVAKNTYFPQIDFLLERNLSKSENPLAPLNQRNDVVGLRLSNSTQEGTSQYSFQYTGKRLNDEAYHFQRQDHEFQFYGNSNMSEQTQLYSVITYAKREYATNQNMEIGGTYTQSEKLQHQVKLQHAENRYGGVARSYDVSNSAAHQSFVSFSDRMQGTFGMMYLAATNVFGETSKKLDRGQVQAQLMISYPMSFLVLTGSAVTNIGFEQYPDQNRKFVQQSQLGMNGVFTSVPHVHISLREDVAFNTNYFFGNQFLHTANINVTTDYIQDCVIGVEGSRSDTKYLDYNLISPQSITSLGGSISMRLSSTTFASMHHLRSWARSWYMDETIKTSATFSESGIIRNLIVQARGEYSFNSIVRQEVLTIEAEINYQFYAFAIGGRFSLRSIGNFQTQGVMLDIRRPFAFSFN